MPLPLPTDPESAAAVGFVAGALSNAAGNLLSDGAKHAAPVLWQSLRSAVGEAMGKAAPQAREQLATNAASFVAVLGAEVATRDAATDPRSVALDVARRLEDPDVAVTVQEALLGAGRTSTSERHAVLAKLVAARLSAEVESERATASALAVRVVPSLSTDQLRVLGLLALIHYAGRPTPAHLPSDPGPSEGVLEDGDAAREHSAAHERYHAAWLESARQYALGFLRQLERHAPIPRVTDVLALHLAGASCVVLHDHGLDAASVTGRILADVSGVASEAEAPFYFGEALRDLTDESPTAEALRSAWEARLGRLTPTPAGLLIGLAVHDGLTGERKTAEWEWSAASHTALELMEREPDAPGQVSVTNVSSPLDYGRLERDPKFQETVANALNARDRYRALVNGDRTVRPPRY